MAQVQPTDQPGGPPQDSLPSNVRRGRRMTITAQVLAQMPKRSEEPGALNPLIFEESFDTTMSKWRPEESLALLGRNRSPSSPLRGTLARVPDVPEVEKEDDGVDDELNIKIVRDQPRHRTQHGELNGREELSTNGGGGVQLSGDGRSLFGGSHGSRHVLGSSPESHLIQRSREIGAAAAAAAAETQEDESRLATRSASPSRMLTQTELQTITRTKGRRTSISLAGSMSPALATRLLGLSTSYESQGQPSGATSTAAQGLASSSRPFAPQSSALPSSLQKAQLSADSSVGQTVTTAVPTPTNTYGLPIHRVAARRLSLAPEAPFSQTTPLELLPSNFTTPRGAGPDGRATPASPLDTLRMKERVLSDNVSSPIARWKSSTQPLDPVEADVAGVESASTTLRALSPQSERRGLLSSAAPSPAKSTGSVASSSGFLSAGLDASIDATNSDAVEDDQFSATLVARVLVQRRDNAERNAAKARVSLTLDDVAEVEEPMETQTNQVQPMIREVDEDSDMASASDDDSESPDDDDDIGPNIKKPNTRDSPYSARSFTQGTSRFAIPRKSQISKEDKAWYRRRRSFDFSNYPENDFHKANLTSDVTLSLDGQTKTQPISSGFALSKRGGSPDASVIDSNSDGLQLSYGDQPSRKLEHSAKSEAPMHSSRVIQAPTYPSAPPATPASSKLEFLAKATPFDIMRMPQVSTRAVEDLEKELAVTRAQAETQPWPSQPPNSNAYSNLLVRDPFAGPLKLPEVALTARNWNYKQSHPPLRRTQTATRGSLRSGNPPRPAPLVTTKRVADESKLNELMPAALEPSSTSQTLIPTLAPKKALRVYLTAGHDVPKHLSTGKEARSMRQSSILAKRSLEYTQKLARTDLETSDTKLPELIRVTPNCRNDDISSMDADLWSPTPSPRQASRNEPSRSSSRPASRLAKPDAAGKSYESNGNGLSTISEPGRDGTIKRVQTQHSNRAPRDLVPMAYKRHIAATLANETAATRAQQRKERVQGSKVQRKGKISTGEQLFQYCFDVVRHGSVQDLEQLFTNEVHSFWQHVRHAQFVILLKVTAHRAQKARLLFGQDLAQAIFPNPRSLLGNPNDQHTAKHATHKDSTSSSAAPSAMYYSEVVHSAPTALSEDLVADSHSLAGMSQTIGPSMNSHSSDTFASTRAKPVAGLGIQSAQSGTYPLAYLPSRDYFLRETHPTAFDIVFHNRMTWRRSRAVLQSKAVMAVEQDFFARSLQLQMRGER